MKLISFLTLVGVADGLFDDDFEGDAVGNVSVTGETVGEMVSSGDDDNSTASIQTCPEQKKR